LQRAALACKERHWRRGLAELDIRHDMREIADMERTTAAVCGGEVKNLTYGQPHQSDLRFQAARLLRWERKPKKGRKPKKRRHPDE
jgi:hypothetical protein